MMAVIKNMKEKIPNHPVLKKEMEKLMTDGLSQDEALNVIVNAYLDTDEEIQRHLTFAKECICSQAGSTKGLNTIRKFRLDTDMLDLKRCKWLNKLATKAIEIQNKMRKEGRARPTL